MLAMVAMFWGASNFIQTICLKEITPLTLVMLRFLVASIALGILCHKRLHHISAASLRWAFVMGIFLAANFFFCTIGLANTTISNTGFFCGLAVVFTPIAEWLFFRKRPSRKVFLVLLMCFAGFFLMTMQGDFTLNTKTLFGDILCICCSVSYTVNILLTERAVQQEDTDAFQMGVLQIFFCCLFGIVFAFLFSTPALPKSGAAWAGIVFVGLFCTAIAFVVQPIAQQHTTGTHTSLILTLEPVFCAFIAYFLANEVYALHNYIGMGLLLAGILIIELDPAELHAEIEKET